MDNEARTGPERLMTLGYVATLSALVLSGAFTYRAAQTQVLLDGWVAHTHEVIGGLEAMRGSLSNAESAQRGYVITGRPEDLDGYLGHVRDARRDLATVAAQTADNPRQQARLPELRTVVEAKVAEMEGPIDARRGGSLAAAQARVATGQGKRLMARIGATVEAMETDETVLLIQRRAEAARGQRTFAASLAVGTLAGLFLLSGLYAIARRLLREQAARRQEEARHRNELERRVEERTAELRVTNENLESFSYSVSHDLRGPLRSIGMQAAMLEEDLPTPTPDQTEGFQRIRRNVARMGSLMDDLLKLSRSTRGELKRTPVDLGEIARRALAEVAMRHSRTDVTTTIQEGLVAQADPSMASILLDNLIRNAWKYSLNTPNAVIEVGREGDAFFVRDSGTGFDDARFEEALEPFRRLHAGSEFEGSGIGLAICNRIVQRHGGRLWARSKPGEGATIFFTLGG